MSLYVLVGPDGKVYENSVATSRALVWENARTAAVRPRGIPRKKAWSGGGVDPEGARSQGWRVRKCHLGLDE